jgi:SET domain-containing protein
MARAEHDPIASTDVVRPGDVVVGASAVHGRGVFADRPFRTGELIEACPVLVVAAADGVRALGLEGYCFEWRDGELALALGYGSLYNHSRHPNARYDHDHDAGIVSYCALRSIRPGEEITVNYSGEPDGRTKLWFDDG